MRMKVTQVEVEQLENEGCTNGNYPRYVATLDNGAEIEGITCRCRNGCSGTDKLPEVGQFIHIGGIGKSEKMIS